MDDRVDTLHGQIVTYLGQISRQELTGAQTGEMISLLEATNSLENIETALDRLKKLFASRGR